MPSTARCLAVLIVVVVAFVVLAPLVMQWLR
jgi:hypothetical protein